MKKSVWLLVALALMGCENKTDPAPQPKTSTLEDTKPAVAGAAKFDIEKEGAKVSFSMEAPNEKIRGTVDKATRGTLEVPLDDVTKTRGHLYVDLGELRLWQRTPGDDFKTEVEEPNQNLHAREWLQISCKEVPEEKMAECEAEAKKNKNVEFVITSVETETKDVSKMTGDERTIAATVSGNFLLHQVSKPRSAKVEIIFKMKGGKPESITLKTVEPFAVGLLEHDVKPNDVFGKLAKETLGTLDDLINNKKKIAEAAEISLDFSAKFTGMSVMSPTQPAGSAK